MRSYRDKEISKDVLHHVLEVGRLAPSASNKQNWKFIVVKDEDLRQLLVPACKNQGSVGETPVIIAGCATDPDYVMTCGGHSYSIDLVAITLDHMSLKAASLLYL